MIDCFARLFGPRAASPDAYVERLWAEEEWTRGCYGCHMPTGAWTNYGPALHPPIGPLHWAGAEYAHVWNGYMDGAVRSGEAARTGRSSARLTSCSSRYSRTYGTNLMASGSRSSRPTVWSRSS